MDLLKKFILTVVIYHLMTSLFAQKTINFLHKWPEPENMVYFNAAVKSFEKANPDIDIRMEAVADEPYKDKIRVLMASDRAPDIFFSWSGEFGKKFARGKRALDITDELTKNNWKQFFSKASLSPFKYRGRNYGIPMNINAKFMLYNTKIFKALGIKEPKNFSNLLNICSKLVKAKKIPISFGNQFPWAASHYLGEIIAKLVPNNIRLADFELTHQTDKLYTSPGYVQALIAFKKMNDRGCFNRGSNALTHSIARGAFTAGRSAMMFMELTEFIRLKGTPLEKEGWDFFKFPSFSKGKGNQEFLTGAPDGFMISAKTKFPDAAIQFLKFLTTVEQGKKYVETTGMTSAVIGAINSKNSDQKTLKGLKILNQASGLALWLDTDMDAQSTEVILAGSQAILNNTESPQEIMNKLHKTAKMVKEKRD